MVKARRGVLIECDPAVKQIILDLDNKQEESGQPRFVYESLDETHLFVDPEYVDELRRTLDEILEENTYRMEEL
ncbi:TFIIH complex subunit tfb5 [Gaertneriomyces sp. JEL0708]|nr:TFIIH complex subunit tfb5 [Gaertneriomyces sp. JEL0708]